MYILTTSYQSHITIKNDDVEEEQPTTMVPPALIVTTTLEPHIYQPALERSHMEWMGVVASPCTLR
eukprot:NODE_2988_length_389_cov_21.691176_g2906_i0.p1 GENE.NODE_2988_length_389_cov_21.691176_g2906_i0~~NODE_2988_length_389_cov_21.691176_g2906_i0.p1  ORF type:complete len:66 (-),score=7.43 NODE_2988_length_389_cov_21.691176_g2906_i0:3-200(-)